MSTLRFETFRMPAADPGPENPLPPLGSRRDIHSIDTGQDIPPEMARNMNYGRIPNIMPYAMQDGYTRIREERDFRTAVLENDILRATFLLEMGGRLWSLVHKPTGRELLCVNPVFQPANLALRNAWFSGGVEWNIGTIGHSPFTCAPLFAARLETPDGTPVLRMYEWERIRQVAFQIDAWLPPGSPVLFVRPRIVNPNTHTVPMYWWSNIAVPDKPGTRVMVPADSAYHFGYGAQGLAVIPTPAHDGQDYTFPAQSQNSADFFFHVPDGKRPWIAALNEEGMGLIQASTPRLKGRKLFVWGMGPGGKRWQEFLSPGGEPYIEIQAGLARTQMEHLPMASGADWSWLEAYGLMEADPTVTHSCDWPMAVQSVEDELEQLITEAELESEYQRGADFQDQPPVEIMQYGSGWGRLEALRREASGESYLPLAGIVFPDDSLTEAQLPWVELLRNGKLPPPNPGVCPGFVVKPEWKERLETSILTEPNWIALYHLGIMRACAGDQEGARTAWQESLQLETNHRAMPDHAMPGRATHSRALRCLALLDLEDGRVDEAVSHYASAVRLEPDLLPLAIECGNALLQCGQYEKWLELAKELPENIRSAGRVQFLIARAALRIGDYESVEEFLNHLVVIPDIREGEEALSDFWFEYQTLRLKSRENSSLDEHELRARVEREFPVPEHLDFRMKTLSANQEAAE